MPIVNRFFKLKSPFSILANSVFFGSVLICLCFLFNVMNHWLWLTMMIAIAMFLASLVAFYLKPWKLFRTKGLLYFDSYILIAFISFLIPPVASIPYFHFLFIQKNSWAPTVFFERKLGVVRPFNLNDN